VKIAGCRPWFSHKGFTRKNHVSCSILFSYYLLTSGTRTWYEIRLKKIRVLVPYSRRRHQSPCPGRIRRPSRVVFETEFQSRVDLPLRCYRPQSACVLLLCTDRGRSCTSVVFPSGGYSATQDPLEVKKNWMYRKLNDTQSQVQRDKSTV
jgi:hypothetical protein